MQIPLPKTIAAWGTPAFDAAFKAELAAGWAALPLQEGLTAGSYAVEDSVEVVILKAAENGASIDAKVLLFYRSLTPGCACAGDPTVESEQTEQLCARVSIDRSTAEAVITRLEE